MKYHITYCNNCKKPVSNHKILEDLANGLTQIRNLDPELEFAVIYFPFKKNINPQAIPGFLNLNRNER
jgi:hypothetical protein